MEKTQIEIKREIAIMEEIEELAKMIDDAARERILSAVYPEIIRLYDEDERRYFSK